MWFCQSGVWKNQGGSKSFVMYKSAYLPLGSAINLNAYLPAGANATEVQVACGGTNVLVDAAAYPLVYNAGFGTVANMTLTSGVHTFGGAVSWCLTTGYWH